MKTWRILLERQIFEENLLEHECVNSKEAEASSSSDHESCPRFVHVAPSTERHLAFLYFTIRWWWLRWWCPGFVHVATSAERYLAFWDAQRNFVFRFVFTRRWWWLRGWCPGFLQVATSTERHLAFRDVQRNFVFCFLFHKKMMMITMMMPRVCTSYTQRRETPCIWIWFAPLKPLVGIGVLFNPFFKKPSHEYFWVFNLQTKTLRW